MPGLPPTKILIVDDHHYAANSLAQILSGLGHVAEVVADGVAALARIEHFRPHVCLVDIAMPRMDGNELARHIRSRAELHDVAVIALTGWASKTNRGESAAGDFDEYLQKPVDFDELEALLARYCAGRTAAVTGAAIISAANAC